MATKIGNYKIPFTQEGNLLGWASTRNPNVIWKDNYTFDGEMEIYNVVRGNSSSKFLFKDNLTGKHYEVFVKCMIDMCKHMQNGIVKGTFTFVKQGENYGLKLVV